MITFIKKIFGITSKPKSKYDDFSVEYYPRTGVYYAKYNDGYLKRHCYSTQVQVQTRIWTANGVR